MNGYLLKSLFWRWILKEFFDGVKKVYCNRRICVVYYLKKENKDGSEMEEYSIIPAERYDNKPAQVSHVTADVKLDIKPEHIKELCKGVGKDRNLENIFAMSEQMLLADTLSSVEKNSILQCLYSAVAKSYDAKNASMIILSIGTVAFMVLIGGGFFFRQMKNTHN